MTEAITTCPIWGTDYEAEGTYDPDKQVYEVTYSERAFCGYIISKTSLDLFGKMLSNQRKARLTTWIVDQWQRGNEKPTVTDGVLLSSMGKSLPVHKRADRLLRYIAVVPNYFAVGNDVHIQTPDYGALAWSESVEDSEIDYFLNFLVERGWLAANPSGYAKFGCQVTVDGHTRVEQLEIEESISSASSQAFVAMWFDDTSMHEAYRNSVLSRQFAPLGMSHSG